MLSKNGYTINEAEGTIIGDDPYGEKFFLIHPLWSEKYVENLKRRLKGEYNKPISIFGLSNLNSQI